MVKILAKMIKNILQSLIASKYNRIVKSNQNSPPNKITEKLQINIQLCNLAHVSHMHYYTRSYHDLILKFLLI